MELKRVNCNVFVWNFLCTLIIFAFINNRSDTNLTILVGILPILGASLEFRGFRMALISLSVLIKPQLEEDVEKEQNCKWLFLVISAILG